MATLKRQKKDGTYEVVEVVGHDIVSKLEDKQDKIIAGKNIKIEDNTISSEGEELTKVSIERALKHRIDSDVPSDAVFTDTTYKHPSNHMANMIVEDTNRRFVTDLEKDTWSEKWRFNEEDIKTIEVDSAKVSNKTQEVAIFDTRNIDETPDDIFKSKSPSLSFDFKRRVNVGTPDIDISAGANYAHVLTVFGWGDRSGGYPTQLSFGKGKIGIRYGMELDEWSEWFKLESEPSKLAVTDNRSINEKPKDTPGKSLQFDFKDSANVDNPPVNSGSNRHSSILTLNSWEPGGDGGGTETTQLAFGESLALRVSEGEEKWGEWKKIPTDEEIEEKIGLAIEDSEIATFASGSSDFGGGGLEVTIPHGLSRTPSFANAVPSEDPKGTLGEVWVRIDATNIYIGNSGSFKGELTWYTGL